MFRKLLLASFCFLIIIFSFANNASAQTIESYLCKVKEDMGNTIDKINIEFPYQEGAGEAVQNLYIKITKTENGNSGIWDALYSTDGDANYWTTPVLRDVATGTDPLVVVQPNELTPSHERLKANFYSVTYPVECTVPK